MGKLGLQFTKLTTPATVHTGDTDFARLTGVSWENPLLG